MRTPARLGLLGLTLLLIAALGPVLTPRPPASAAPTAPTADFSGFTTASGAELGVRRLPDGRFGICLDTGPRAWPATRARARLVTDPITAYLLSTRLESARRDPVLAAALWWAVGRRGLNSRPDLMRAHLAELRRERPDVAGAVARAAAALVREARVFAPRRGGYAVPRPVLRSAGTTGTLSGLDVRSAGGLPVPGIRVTVTLHGATFPDGTVSHAATTSPRPLTLAWRRSGTAQVTARVRYERVPQHRYRRYPGSARRQRVAATAGLRRLDARASLPGLRRPALSTQVNLQRAHVGARLLDRVTVTGLGRAPGSTVRGAWQLLGPMAPAAGCSGIDWSRAPITAQGSFSVNRDGPLTVGATTISTTGCYTYRERLSGSPTTAEVPWTRAGIADETSLVTSTPRLRTRVNLQRAVTGTELVDQVTVTGLPTGPGTTTTPLTGQWQLLGPVAPDRSGRCAVARWAGAPITAAGRFVVAAAPSGSATVTVGRTQVRVGGCYTYREMLAPTAQSEPASWTAAGIAEESSLVAPRQPTVPEHPKVDTGGFRAPVRGRAATGPRISLPRTGIDAGLTGVDFRGSVLPAPYGPRLAGLWSPGAPLDALVGTTVVDGHVSDDHDRPGVFHRLRAVRVGDRVRTSGATSGRAGVVHDWRVVRIRTFDRNRLPRSLFDQGIARRLVLISCTDRVSTGGGGFHYRKNLVIEAVPW